MDYVTNPYSVYVKISALYQIEFTTINVATLQSNDDFVLSSEMNDKINPTVLLLSFFPLFIIGR